MLIEKYSDRLKNLIQAGQDLAARSAHLRFTPLHILKALLDDESQLAANLIEACGGDAAQADQAVQRELANLPKARGGGAGQIYLTPETTWLFDQAEQLSRKAADSFLIADHLLLGLTIESGAIPADICDRMGVTARKLIEVISRLRRMSADATDQSGFDQEGLKAQNAELRDRMLRGLAEAENTRRRSERLVEDAGRYALADFARQILAVADNLQRAMDAAGHPANLSGRDTALLEGVQATARMLADILERASVRKIDALGARFDPSFHEAMMQVDDPLQPPGTVTRVLEDGYTIHDRLLRPARVVVAKASSNSQPRSSEQTPVAVSHHGSSD